MELLAQYGAPDEALPQWIWKLRTAWVTTQTYARIRDGIGDKILRPLGG